MIVIVGGSASGKTSLLNEFIKTHKGYKKVIEYTTRPKRYNEIQGKDYHFINEKIYDSFLKKDMFAISKTYNGWHYGILKSDCNQDNSILVTSPSSCRELKKLDYNITSVYLYVDRRSRLIKLLNRGDDIEESYRRNVSEVGQFDGFESEADYIIVNTEYHMDIEKVTLCMESVLERRDSENSAEKEGE